MLLYQLLTNSVHYPPQSLPRSEITSGQNSQQGDRDCPSIVEAEFITKPHLLTLRPLFGRVLPRLDPVTNEEILAKVEDDDTTGND